MYFSFWGFFCGGLLKIKMPQYEYASCIDSDNICRFKKPLSIDRIEIKFMTSLKRKNKKKKRRKLRY